MKKKFKFTPKFGLLLFLILTLGILVLNRENISAWGGHSKPKKKAPVVEKNKIVFVIDDIGYHLQEEVRLTKLGDKVTYAILPLLPYSKYFGNLSKKTGAEVILHMPLEAMDGTIPGRGLITRAMPAKEILKMVDTDLNSVPNHVGSNNHMGSLGTSDPALMKIILEDIKRRNLFYLDSFTSSDSVVVPVAQELGVPVLKRDVFLDNIDAKQAIRDQIKQLKSISRKKGYAIGIGHYRANTLEVLIQDIPVMEQEGFEMISLQELLDYLGTRKSSPAHAA